MSFLLFVGASAAHSVFYYEETITSVVQIWTYDSTEQWGTGTGFFISADGLILTNAHVALDSVTGEPAEYIQVCPIENEYSTPVCMFAAEVWAYEPELDLALLSLTYFIDEEGAAYGDYLDDSFYDEFYIPYVDFADTWPELGETVTILGFPGASGLQSITFTEGTVSGFNFYSEDWLWEFVTDATINPGNSGGPVYNWDERILGIATAYSINELGGSYGYVTSSDIVLLWFLSLVEQGYLNEDFVYEIFSNDYIDEFEGYDYGDVQIFTDVDFTTANSAAISYLKDVGIVSGYPDGSFKPASPLNRAELLKILVEGVGYSPDATIYKNCFPDVGTDWYAKYVCFAKEMGWVEVYPDNTFRPSNDVNKVEALKMLLETFGVYTSTDYDVPYYDTPSSEWYAKYVFTAYNMGLLEEYGNYYWPSAAITRGQVSENLYRLLLTEFY